VAYVWIELVLAMLKGIEPHEVLQALGARRRLPVPGMSGDVPIIVILARTDTGRPLAVGVRKTSSLDQEIVGVRDMHPDELATFERWEAGS
jgi:hypothetical protein